MALIKSILSQCVNFWLFLVYICKHDLNVFIALSGSVTLDELMTGLMSAHETFQQAMDVEIREEVGEMQQGQSFDTLSIYPVKT